MRHYSVYKRIVSEIDGSINGMLRFFEEDSYREVQSIMLANCVSQLSKRN